MTPPLPKYTKQLKRSAPHDGSSGEHVVSAGRHDDRSKATVRNALSETLGCLQIQEDAISKCEGPTALRKRPHGTGQGNLGFFVLCSTAEVQDP